MARYFSGADSCTVVDDFEKVMLDLTLQGRQGPFIQNQEARPDKLSQQLQKNSPPPGENELVSKTKHPVTADP